MTTNRTSPGLAAKVREAKLLAVAELRLCEYEDHWINKLPPQEQAIFTASRTLTRPGTSEAEPDVESEYTYAFAHFNGFWYGAGRTTPNGIDRSDMVDWLIDHDVDPDDVHRWSPDLQ